MKTIHDECSEALSDGPARNLEAEKAEARRSSERSAATVFQLRNRIRKLEEAHASLEETNDELRSELDDARTQHDEDMLRIEALEEQIDDMRAGMGNGRR